MMPCNALLNYNPLNAETQLETLQYLYEIQFALERMQANINLINTGPNAREVSLTATTLYQVAADYYQDATLWTYLAQVNNLSDPVITSPITILVPPAPPASVDFGS
jgi:hypothetical protein